MAIPTYEEIAACQQVLFEWADSYDTKDWDRLAKILSPSLKVDYSSIMGKQWDALPARDFVQMVSNKRFLGNPRLKTQHFIGLGVWQKVTRDEIQGTFQIRVAHQKYVNDDLKEVAMKGHDHGTGIMLFKQIDSDWKFAGLQPNSRWGEFNMEQIFA